MRLFRSCLVVVPFTLGCADVLGLDAYGVGGGAGSTTTSAGGTTSSGGAGGTTSSGGTGGVTGGTGGATGGTGGVTGGTGGATGGGGTTGGGGVGGATGCNPGDTKPCYDGPAGTEGFGLCKGGTSTCDGAGAWGPCLNEVLPSIELCKLDGVDENCDQNAECVGTTGWAKVLQDTDSLSPTGIATDLDDNMVLVGGFKGTIDFGGGSFTAMDVDPYIVALGPDGAHRWSRAYVSAGIQQVNAVATDKDGSVIVAGTFAGTMTIGAETLMSAGGNDAFAAKLDKNGNALWARSFGGTSGDRALAVAVSSAGEVYVAGGYIGDVTIAGVPLPTATPGENVLVIKLDPAGNPLWSKGFGDASSQLGTAVAVDVNGSPWIGANATGNLDFGCGATADAGGGDIVIAKLDPALGACAMAKRFGDAGQQITANLVAAVGGGVIFGAAVTGAVAFGGINTTGDATLDVVVGKIGNGGAIPWVKRFGALGTGQYQQGLAVDATGNVVVSGSFAGSIDFTGGAGGVLTAQTPFDRYVAKLTPQGAPLWSRGFTNSSAAYTFVATDHVGRVDLHGNITGQTDLGTGSIGVAGSPLSLLVAQLAP